MRKIILKLREFFKRIFSKKESKLYMSENNTQVAISNTLSKLLEETKKGEIIWSAVISTNRINYINLLISHFYKKNNLGKFSLEDTFYAVLGDKKFITSKVYIPNVTYYHFTVCDKDFRNILVDFHEWSSQDTRNLYNIVKASVIDNIVKQSLEM